MSILLALICGAVIGVVLGALGGGGSILAVPAFVYVLGESARDATTASLVVIGITSAIAAISYHRSHHVRWATGFIFGVFGIAASFAGTILNRNVDQDVLLAAFAAVTALSAVGMIARGWREKRILKSPPEVPANEGYDPGPVSGESTLLKTQPHIATGTKSRLLTALQVIITSLVVGFLTGFLGVGGGFIVVPALVMILGYSMPLAAGTSLLIIALNSAVSLSIRASSQLTFNWDLIVPFTVAAILAAEVGRQLASRFSSTTLALSFAVILLLVAAGIGIETTLPFLGIS